VCMIHWVYEHTSKPAYIQHSFSLPLSCSRSFFVSFLSPSLSLSLSPSLFSLTLSPHAHTQHTHFKSNMPIYNLHCMLTFCQCACRDWTGLFTYYITTLEMDDFCHCTLIDAACLPLLKLTD